jgi:hypothetical protein
LSFSGIPVFVNYGKLTHKPIHKTDSNSRKTVQNAVSSTCSRYYCIYVSNRVLWLSMIAYNSPTQRKSVIVSKIYDRIICPREHLCHNCRSLLSIDYRFHSVTASNMLANIQWSFHYMNSYSCSTEQPFFPWQSYRVYLCNNKLVL